MISNKFLWIICAIISGSLLVPISIGFYDKYHIYTEGEVVDVVILSAPNGISTSNRGALWFKYKDTSYSIGISGPVSNIYHIGDTVQLKHLKLNDEDRFILPHDSPIVSNTILILILIAGFFSSVYYVIYPPRN